MANMTGTRTPAASAGEPLPQPSSGQSPPQPVRGKVAGSRRRRPGLVLAIIGVVLLCLSAACRFAVYPRLPLLPGKFTNGADYIGTASVLNAAGMADPNQPLIVDNVPLTIKRTVKGEGSHGNTDVVSDTQAFQMPGSPQISTTHRFAVNRDDVSAATIPKGSKAEQHAGYTISWPRDVGKHSYPMWDAFTQQTVPANYVRTEKVQGRTAYVFAYAPKGPLRDQVIQQMMPPALPKSALERLLPRVPQDRRATAEAQLAVLPDTVPLTYVYDSTSTVWVDQASGMPMRVQQHISITAMVQTATGTAPFADLMAVDAHSAPKVQHDAVNKAKLLGTVLLLSGTVGPLVFAVLGVAALVFAGLRRKRAVAATPGGQLTTPGGTGTGGDGEQSTQDEAKGQSSTAAERPAENGGEDGAAKDEAAESTDGDQAQGTANDTAKEGDAAKDEAAAEDEAEPAKPKADSDADAAESADAATDADADAATADPATDADADAKSETTADKPEGDADPGSGSKASPDKD